MAVEWNNSWYILNILGNNVRVELLIDMTHRGRMTYRFAFFLHTTSISATILSHRSSELLSMVDGG